MANAYNPKGHTKQLNYLVKQLRDLARDVPDGGGADHAIEEVQRVLAHLILKAAEPSKTADPVEAGPAHVSPRGATFPGIDIYDVSAGLEEVGEPRGSDVPTPGIHSRPVRAAPYDSGMSDEPDEENDVEFQRGRANHYVELIKEWEATLKAAGADLDVDSINAERLVEAAKEVFDGLNIVAHEDD